MTILLAVGALFAAVTVWFLARPVRGMPAAGQGDYDALVQLRDRLLAQLHELDVETGDRSIDASVAADERQRLEAELAQVLKDLETVAPAQTSAAASSPRGLWLATTIVLAAVLPLVSAGLYLIGNGTVLSQLAQMQSLANDEGVPPMVLEMVARLEQRLAEQPDDPQGWARLGRSYMVLGREADARKAYARALELAPKDTEIMSAYAGFLLALDPARPSPEAVALFRQVHAADPDNPGALWALGVVAFQNQEFGRAVTYWEQILQQLPADSEVASQVRRGIEEARAQAAARASDK